MSAPDTPFYPVTHDDAVAIIAALNAIAPGLVTGSQAGLLAADAVVENGFIKQATGSNKGLMPAAFAGYMENPEALAFISGKALTRTAGYHNSIFRGKYLGDSVTSKQYSKITMGGFDDMIIGDYWTIDDVNWRIAAFDYWYGCGDTQCITHHVLIVPDTCITTSALNSNSAFVTGAYVGSDYYQDHSIHAKGLISQKINNAFGSGHILSHREYLKNAVTGDGYESAGAWYDSKFELMTEQMVLGCKVHANSRNGGNAPNGNTIGMSQLPLFALAHFFIPASTSWWLRDVVSDRAFAGVSNYGTASFYTSTTDVIGLRPCFGLKG